MAGESKESLIYIDDLTNLYNRRYLYFELPKQLQQAKEQKYNLWLFMLDIDNFKIINDTYGHLCGDGILKDVARILQENTKAEDKKIRYAGDEFTVILPKLESRDVLNVAQRIVTKIDAYHFREKYTNKEIHLTISMGVAGHPQDSVDATELINLADKALYISKQKGKNCISTASEITPDLFWKKDIMERFPCPIFVERAGELSRLQDALNQVFEPKSNFFLINGELGIGKSRLLNEFERIVIQRQVSCLPTRCIEKFVTQPYYVLGELLDRYLFGLDKIPQEFLAGIPVLELASLFQFLPILKDTFGALPTKETTVEERDSLSKALIKFLVNISKQKPLCILFDDIHYADAQTLEVLSRIIQRQNEFPILIAATFCTEELLIPGIGPSPLSNVIKKEEFLDLVQILTLNGLSNDGARLMIENLFLDIPLTADFPEIIYRITKGNPLFIEELLKYIIEKELVLYQDGKWVQREIDEASLPHAIGEAIQARMEDLSIETKDMIAKAAVIGEDFQVDLLQKIDSEDRGYIIDLIESAKKIGLIYERGFEGRDEFSFVTNEIRKVLLKAIGGEKTRRLYSRLGEIKEKLYPDKLNNIAGELYYNFKKAEDFMRAEQYATMVKEGKNIFYDRTMKYAQSLLEEALEERITQPLSKKNWRVVPELIRSIYIASVNYILYPPQNKMRVQSVEEIHKKLLIIFSEINALNIACLEGAVVVNNKKVGRELPPFFSNSFVSLLRNLNIESITFKKEIEQQELSAFIDVLSSTEKREKSVTDLLQGMNMPHIHINEISFDITKKKSREKESLEEVMLIDYLLGKMPADGKKADLTSAISTHAQEITQALEKVGDKVSKESGKNKESVKAEIMAKSIQKLGDKFLQKGKDEWKKYKEGLAKTLLSMEPNLRASILSSQPEEKDKLDIIKELSPELPDEVITDVLTTQYIQKDTTVDKMKNLTQRFLSAPSKKEKLVPILEERLKQMGASQEECDYIFKEDIWKETTSQERANRIINLPMKSFVKMLPALKIDSLVKELLSQGQEALVDALLEKLLTVLEQKHADSQYLVSYFKDLLENLIQGSPERLLPEFVKKLLRVCSNKEEFVPFFLFVVSPYLDRIIQILLDVEQLLLIKELIQMYAKDTRFIRENSGILEPVTARLVRELVSRIELNFEWMELAEALILLRELAARHLVEEALFENGVPDGKYFEAYLRRRTIGKILEQMPKESFLGLVADKCADPRYFVIKNLIELIGAMDDEEMIKILEIPLRHPEVRIRKKAIFALRKRKGENSARLLGEALKDEDPDVAQEALHILKDRDDDFARQILNQFMKDKNLPSGE